MLFFHRHVIPAVVGLATLWMMCVIRFSEVGGVSVLAEISIWLVSLGIRAYLLAGSDSWTAVMSRGRYRLWLGTVVGTAVVAATVNAVFWQEQWSDAVTVGVFGVLGTTILDAALLGYPGTPSADAEQRSESPPATAFVLVLAACLGIGVIAVAVVYGGWREGLFYASVPLVAFVVRYVACSIFPSHRSPNLWLFSFVGSAGVLVALAIMYWALTPAEYTRIGLVGLAMSLIASVAFDLVLLRSAFDADEPDTSANPCE